MPLLQQLVQCLQVQALAPVQVRVVFEGGRVLGQLQHLDGGQTGGARFGVLQQRVEVPHVGDSRLHQHGCDRHDDQHGGGAVVLRRLDCTIVVNFGVLQRRLVIPNGGVPERLGPGQGHRVRALRFEAALAAAAHAGAALGDGAQQKAVEGGHGVGCDCTATATTIITVVVVVVAVSISSLRHSKKGDGFAKEISFEFAVVRERFLGGAVILLLSLLLAVIVAVVFIVAFLLVGQSLRREASPGLSPEQWLLTASTTTTIIRW